MSLLHSVVLLVLFITSCNGFNVIIPSSPTVTRPATFQWKADSSDVGVNTVGVFLISAGNDTHCPTNDFAHVFSPKFFNIVDDYTVFTISPGEPGSESSGSLLLQAKRSELHIVCAYGGFPLDFATNQQSLDPQNIRLLSESSGFNVTNGNSKDHWPNGSQFRWHDDHTTKIVGGVVGAVAALCLGLAIFFYRKFRYQQKVNQFHKEHALLNQQPPPSMSSTLGYPAYNTRVTSPPPATAESSTSPPTIRPLGPHISLGFDETMQKSYHFPSVGSSPSSFSVPLPNEPILRAQHAPGTGTVSPAGY